MEPITVVFILIGLALAVGVVLFILGAARLSARADSNAYYATILRNIELHAEFDREHRNG